jgi:hypothetical protein
MGDYLFHYTSRQLAQEIIISGLLKPRPHGKIYLTEDTYERGADVAKYLAIVNKPVEVVCMIPEAKVADLSDPRHVKAIHGPDGEVIRPGCGSERYTTKEVDVEDLVWLGLSVP